MIINKTTRASICDLTYVHTGREGGRKRGRDRKTERQTDRNTDINTETHTDEHTGRARGSKVEAKRRDPYGAALL